jgi:hypothetical protein
LVTLDEDEENEEEEEEEEDNDHVLTLHPTILLMLSAEAVFSIE